MRDRDLHPDTWLEELPPEFLRFIVAPRRYEQHDDEIASASKLIGLDPDGRRCYIRHLHTEIEQRFDIDEFPIEVATGRERRIAWRLRSGQWLLQVERIERLESCRPRHLQPQLAVVTERALGL